MNCVDSQSTVGRNFDVLTTCPPISLLFSASWMNGTTRARYSTSEAENADIWPAIWPIAKAGDVRPLAVTTPQRVRTAPDLPTIGETVTGYEAVGWQGLFAPAKTPRPIVEELAAEVKRIFLQPELVTALQNVGGEPLPMSPDEFARFAQSERVKWGAVVRDAGIRIE